MKLVAHNRENDNVEDKLKILRSFGDTIMKNNVMI